jgi:sugar-specific transcriptional regulator TrmB
LSPQDNGVNIFTQLGLTNRQAEVYIAIVKLEQPTARSIAQTLQIARAEVYRATAELQKLGLIKKIVTTPTAFRATPLSEGLSILLQRNAEKHKEIRNEAKQFLRNFKNHNREKPSQENARYYLTSGSKPVERQYLRDLSEIQTSKDCVLEWRGIIALVNRDFEYVKEALEKGVKIRYITYIPEGTKMPQIIQILTKTGSFEVKSASTIPKAGLDIFDKKLVHIITLPNSNPKEVEVLRSNNPAVAELVHEYFELKWQSATIPC